MENIFFAPTNDSITKIILIKTDFIGNIDAKLKVYKKYKRFIDTRGPSIFLQHEHEEFDEAAKLIANRKVVACCRYVDEMKSNIGNLLAREQPRPITMFPLQQTVHPLRTVIAESIEKTLTLSRVRDICYDIYLEKVGSVHSSSYLCYSSFTIKEIKESLVRKTWIEIAKTLGKEISDDVLHHMETVLQDRLVREFRLTRFQISDDIYHRIQQTIIGRIIEILETVSGWMVTIATFIINIFSPVDVNSFEWRRKVADEIHSKIYDHKNSIKDLALTEILGILNGAIRDLNVIAINLQTFRERTIPNDQYQRK